MTHSFGGGGDLSLATLWVPVQPETRGLHEEFVKVGEEGRKAFEEGFDRVGHGLGSKLSSALAQGFQQSLPGGFSHAFGELRGQIDQMSTSAVTAHAAFDRYTNSARLVGEAVNRTHTEETKLLNTRNQIANISAQIAAKEAVIADLYGKHSAGAGKLQQEEQNLQSLRTKGNSLATKEVAQEAQVANAVVMHSQRVRESSTAHERYNETLEKTHHHLNLGAIGTAALTGAVTGLTMAATNLAFAGLGAMVHGLEDVVRVGVDAAKEVVNIGQHFQELNREVTLFTTESGPALQSLQDSMRNIYANMLDVPSKKLGETVGVLHAQFGLTGQELETLTTHITEMGERFGELPIRDFAAAMHQFGIQGGPELDKALGTLIYDTQQFGIALPQLMSDMVQMGPIWDALHVNYNSAALAIAKITQLGDPARRVMLGLSQTAKEMAKGPDPDGTFKQYVQDVIQTMENLQKTGGDQLADAFALSEFGVRTWALLKQTLDPIQDAIRGVGSEAAKIDLTKLIEQTRILHEKVTLFRHDIEARLAPLGLNIVNHIGGGLTTVQHWFDTHQTEILGKIKEWGNKFIDNIPKIQHFAGEAVKFIGDFVTFSVKSVGFVSEAFGMLFHNDTMTKFGQALTNFDMRPMTDKIGNAIEDVHIDTNPLHQWLGASIDNMMKNQPQVGIKADLKTPDGKSLIENTKEVAKNAGISFGQGFEEGFSTAAAEHMPPWLKFLFQAGNVDNVPGHGALGKVLEPPPQDENPDPAKRSSPYGGATPGAEPDKGARGGGGNVGEDPEKFRAGQAYEKDHNGRMPPNYQQWLENRGPMPPEMQPYYKPQMPATPGYGLHWEDGKGWVPDKAHTSGYTEPVNNAPVVLAGKYDPAPHANETPSAPPGIGMPSWTGMPKSSGRGSGKDPALQEQERQDRIDNARDSLDNAKDAYADAVSAAKIAEKKDKPLIDKFSNWAAAAPPGSKLREGYEEQRDAATRDLTRARQAVTHALHAQDHAERGLTEATEKAAEATSSSGRKTPGQSFLSGVTGSIGLGDIFGDNQGLLKLLGVGGADGLSGGGSVGGAEESSVNQSWADTGSESDPSQTSPFTSSPLGSASLMPSVSATSGTPAISGAMLASATSPMGASAWPATRAGSPPGAPVWSQRPISHAPMGGASPGSAGVAHQGTGALPGPSSGGVSGGSGPPALAGNDRASIANFIYQTALYRGYPPDDATAIVAYAVGESGLNPNSAPGKQGDDNVIGLFQEKTQFSGGLTEEQRKDPVANVNAYLNQLDKHRGTGDIMDQLLATSVGGPMYTGGRAAMVPLLKEAQGLINPNVRIGPNLRGTSPAGYGGPQLPGEEHLQPAAVALRRTLFQQFPELQQIGGWREKDALPYHPSGRALDVMIPGQGGLNDPTTPEGKVEGARILTWLRQHAAEFGIQMDGTLWQQPDHFNHIHVQLAGPMPAAGPPPAAAPPLPAPPPSTPIPHAAPPKTQSMDTPVGVALGGLIRGFQHGGVVGFDQGGEAGGDNFYKRWYPRSQTPTPTASSSLLRPDNLGGLLGATNTPSSAGVAASSPVRPWGVAAKPWTPPVTPLQGFRSLGDEHRATGFGRVSRAASSFTGGLIPDVALDYDTLRHWGQHTGMEQAGAVIDTASMIPGLGTVLGAGVAGLGHGVAHGIGAIRGTKNAAGAAETIERALRESQAAVAAAGPKPIPGGPDDPRLATRILRGAIHGPVKAAKAPFKALTYGANWIRGDADPAAASFWGLREEHLLRDAQIDAKIADRADEQMKALIQGDSAKGLYGDYPTGGEPPGAPHFRSRNRLGIKGFNDEDEPYLGLRDFFADSGPSKRDVYRRQVKKAFDEATIGARAEAQARAFVEGDFKTGLYGNYPPSNIPEMLSDSSSGGDYYHNFFGEPLKEWEKKAQDSNAMRIAKNYIVGYHGEPTLRSGGGLEYGGMGTRPFYELDPETLQRLSDEPQYFSSARHTAGEMRSEMLHHGFAPIPERDAERDALWRPTPGLIRPVTPELRVGTHAYGGWQNQGWLKDITEMWSDADLYQALRDPAAGGALRAIRSGRSPNLEQADMDALDTWATNASLATRAGDPKIGNLLHTRSPEVEYAARRLGGEFVSMMEHEDPTRQSIYRGFKAPRDVVSQWREGNELSLVRPTSFAYEDTQAVEQATNPDTSWQRNIEQYKRETADDPESWRHVVFELQRGAKVADISAHLNYQDWDELLTMGDFGIDSSERDVETNDGNVDWFKLQHLGLNPTGEGFQHGGEVDDHSGFENLMLGPINKASGALFTGEGPEYYGAAFNYNKQFAKPSTTNYRTRLSPAEEKSFRAWVKGNKVNFNPNESVSDYDMRGYWKSTGGVSNQKGFFPDTFKTPYDTDFSPQSIYSKPDNPLKWTDAATLKNTRDGTTVFFNAEHYKSIGKAFGGVVGFAGGGAVGPTDTVPALLQAGSVVLNTRAVAAIGLDNALGINALGYKDGGSVSAAPNISMPVTLQPGGDAMSSFKNNSISGALSGISSIAAGLGADFNPKQWQGILQQPQQRPSAVHYNNSIHIQGNTMADPAGLQRVMQEQQNAQRGAVGANQ